MRRGYIRVATIKLGEIKRLALPSFLEFDNLEDRISELADFLAGSSLPFPASDHYEYWLLDAKDESPLALIFSCVKQQEMPSYPVRYEWTALPASMMKIEPTPEEQQIYVPPVNYRLERLVAERAGQRPRAVWINRRRAEDTETLPPCLVTEHWEDESQAILCQRYIRRQAPRLLMLHGLSHKVRQRLEIAAKDHALEVERFHRLYPEVADPGLMAAIRVEANLRRAADHGPPGRTPNGRK